MDTTIIARTNFLACWLSSCLANNADRSSNIEAVTLFLNGTSIIFDFTWSFGIRNYLKICSASCLSGKARSNDNIGHSMLIQLRSWFACELWQWQIRVLSWLVHYRLKLKHKTLVLSIVIIESRAQLGVYRHLVHCQLTQQSWFACDRALFGRYSNRFIDDWSRIRLCLRTRVQLFHRRIDTLLFLTHLFDRLVERDLFLSLLEELLKFMSLLIERVWIKRIIEATTKLVCFLLLEKHICCHVISINSFRVDRHLALQLAKLRGRPFGLRLLTFGAASIWLTLFMSNVRQLRTSAA